MYFRIFAIFDELLCIEKDSFLEKLCFVTHLFDEINYFL